MWQIQINLLLNNAFQGLWTCCYPGRNLTRWSIIIPLWGGNKIKKNKFSHYICFGLQSDLLMTAHLRWQLKLISWTAFVKSWQNPFCWLSLQGWELKLPWWKSPEDNHQNLYLSNSCMEKTLLSVIIVSSVYYLNCIIFLWFSADDHIRLTSLKLPLIIRTRIARLHILYLSWHLPQQLLWFHN